MKRTNYHVLYKNKRWEVHVGKEIIQCCETKKQVVTLMRNHCNFMWIDWGQTSELWVHNKKDGRITAKGRSTYGNDPKRSKG